jgi:NAD(P)-dependent dehydrogenase (short-subunit alcohol dehydrogenase family)
VLAKARCAPLAGAGDKRTNAMTTFRDNLLAGKTAFVAGASSGINLQIATRLAQAGAAVTIISRSPEKISAAAAGIRATGARCIGIAQDVRDHDGVGAAFAASVAEHGPIDILVSGAAGNFVAPFNGLSYNGFRAVIDIDLVGTFNVMRQGFQHLRLPGASCINISAPQSIHPYPGQSHVNAAKAGVDMLTRTLAVEWGAEGVRINSIIPGPIADTEGMARLAPNPEAMERSKKGTPMKRLGTKDEVADLALFLCSDAAAYITGAIIPVDGGLSLMGVGRPG